MKKPQLFPQRGEKNNLIGTWKCHTVGSVQAGDREGIFSTEFICIFIRKLFTTKCNMRCRLQCLPSLPIGNFYITLSSYLCLISAFCFSSPFIWERAKSRTTTTKTSEQVAVYLKKDPAFAGVLIWFKTSKSNCFSIGEVI